MAALDVPGVSVATNQLPTVSKALPTGRPFGLSVSGAPFGPLTPLRLSNQHPASGHSKLAVSDTNSAKLYAASLSASMYRPSVVGFR